MQNLYQQNLVKLDCGHSFLLSRFDQIDDQAIVKLNTMDHYLVYEGLQVIKFMSRNAVS